MNVIHRSEVARFKEIASALPIASSSTLSETLRALNAAGLVINDANPEAGRTTYALTPSGEKLLNRLRRLLDDVQP